MYRTYVAVVTLAAAEHLPPNDVAMEFKAMLDDLQSEQIKPLELLRMERLSYDVTVAFLNSGIKAEATV